jgi:hypothetical protein
VAFGPGGAPAEGGIVQCAALPSKGPALWLHGDLHAANVVVSDGTLVALARYGRHPEVPTLRAGFINGMPYQ